MKEVEIIKIGTILSFGDKFIPKPTLMCVSDGDSVCDYYVSILIENTKHDFSMMRTQQSIIGYSNPFSASGMSLYNLKNVNSLKNIKIIPDSEPVVGKLFLDANSSWHTSEVKRIIDACIIITKHSVYAIHDVSNIRDRKLKDLGI